MPIGIIPQNCFRSSLSTTYSIHLQYSHRMRLCRRSHLPTFSLLRASFHLMPKKKRESSISICQSYTKELQSDLHFYYQTQSIHMRGTNSAHIVCCIGNVVYMQASSECIYKQLCAPTNEHRFGSVEKAMESLWSSGARLGKENCCILSYWILLLCRTDCSLHPDPERGWRRTEEDEKKNLVSRLR